MRSDRSEDFLAYYKSLALERGRLMFVFWLNALATLGLQAALLAVVVRAGRRAAWTDYPIAAIAESVRSLSRARVAVAFAGHELARQRLLRRLDQRIRAAKTTN